MSKLETNTIDNISGSSTLTIGDTNTSTITLKSGATLTNFPDNTPAFLATKTGSSNQSVSGATATKITFDNEVFDTNSDFASNKFTPTTAGKYFISYQVRFAPSGGGMEDAFVQIYKNGSELGNFARDQQSGNVDQFQDGQNSSLSGTVTDTANGTGDYYELYVYHQSGHTVIYKDALFQAYKLIGV